DLQNQGYSVSVLTRIPERYLASGVKQRKGIFFNKESKNGIKIYRIKSLPAPKHIPLARALDHLWTSFSFLVSGIFLGKYDFIIVYSPPLPLALSGYIFSKIWRGKVIVNVQDIYPQTVIDLRLLRNRFLIRLAEWMELYIYKKVHAIIVHSEGNRNFLVKRGAPSQKVHVVENWIDLDILKPGEKLNGWRKINHLDNAFIVSFAGTMGFAQGLEEIIEIAEKLRNYSNIIFVFAGDGIARPVIERFVVEKKLTNVRLLSHQSPNLYKEMLQASDICLVTLNKNLKTPVVPGKLQCIMAVGRPVICIANPASDAKRIIEEAECGFFINPGDLDELSEAILKIYKERNLAENMGKKGRRYAEKHFDRRKCVQKYLALLSNL
ncbi:glycosyltransferase family 4 protein, partial [Candidatus Aminicenantes bacterium AC-334-E05]|nr:glycosyltransferase family 4 protein [Candidatus Aminicenantes bacterium AC-334-E05]